MKTRLDLVAIEARDLPHASCELLSIVIKPKDPDSESSVVLAETYTRSVDEYFYAFTHIGEENKCPGCDESLGGLLGNFIWGNAFGEGKCRKCGWPCRAVHRIEGVLTLDAILPYHPTFLRLEAERATNSVE